VWYILIKKVKAEGIRMVIMFLYSSAAHMHKLLFRYLWKVLK